MSRFSYIKGITSSAIMKLPKIHFHQWFHQKASATIWISVHKTYCRNAVLAIAHQTFQPSWLVEVLNAMTNTSLNSSVGRASVYQNEGPEFNHRLGRKSFESFLNFYLINDVFYSICRGQEPIQLHNGHNFQCNHEASKNPLPPIILNRFWLQFNRP